MIASRSAELIALEVGEAELRRASLPTQRFRGRTCHFCSPACKQRFDQSPEKFGGVDAPRSAVERMFSSASEEVDQRFRVPTAE